MNNQIKNLLLLFTFTAGLGLMVANRLTAQSFTTVYSFTAAPGPLNTNSDGAYPQDALILSGNTLYGTTTYGGTWGNGTVFAVNTDGTGFTVLHTFTATTGSNSINSDGALPIAGLILSDNTLYGTATAGGSAGGGTVFKVSTDGTGFTAMHSFTLAPGPLYTNSDGTHPYGGLILSGNTLYGATTGGASGSGAVFSINTDTTGFTIVRALPGGSGGALPYAGLILSGNTLFGTTAFGGASHLGTVFGVNTDGTAFTNLSSFTTGSGTGDSDGGYPYAPLILSGETLYGTTTQEYDTGYGTVFKVNTDGTGFSTLHSFTAGGRTNCDGMKPYGGLVLSSNTLYGTANFGGASGVGTLFAVNTDATGFTVLHTFTGFTDGAYPSAGLILSSNTLYGTTYGGGSSGNGAIFSLSLGPVSVGVPKGPIFVSGNNIILSWPTNFAGLTLQSTTNLFPPVVWSTVVPAPVIVNGQYAVTNPIAGIQKFYRWSQ